MLNELLIQVAEDKNLLLSNFNSLFDDISSTTIESKWNTHQFKKDVQTNDFIAVDGSINNENLVTETIYALSSHALYSNTAHGIKQVSLKNKVEIMSNGIESYNSIFSKQMNIFELKTILNSLYLKPEVDYLLVDGDLFSILNHVASIVNTSLRKNKFVQEFTEEIIKNEENNYSLDVPTVTSLIEEIPKNLEIPTNEIVLYFQMIEQLCILKNILSDYSQKIISISKTCRTRTLYENKYFSDRALLTKYCKKSGYSDETFIDDTRFRVYVNNMIQYGQYPVYDNFFRNLNFTNRFVRLSDKGSIIKVQLVNHAGKNEFEQIFEDLHSISLNRTGYPFLLKKVHDDVKISSKDIKIILRQLDKQYELKERNVL